MAVLKMEAPKSESNPFSFKTFMKRGEGPGPPPAASAPGGQQQQQQQQVKRGGTKKKGKKEQLQSAAFQDGDAGRVNKAVTIPGSFVSI